MKVIVTVDDSFGMLFNKRRQSQDRILRERILEISKACKLWMNLYSALQFKNMDSNIYVAEDFLEQAQNEDYCFVENQHIAPYQQRIDELILVHWNRKYPSDFKLDMIPSELDWICVQRDEFSGYSHDKITMEYWRKR